MRARDFTDCEIEDILEHHRSPLLRCHGRRVEVATRLIESEREDLAAELQGWLGLQHASIELREAEALNPGLASPAQQAQREGIWQ